MRNTYYKKGVWSLPKTQAFECLTLQGLVPDVGTWGTYLSSPIDSDSEMERATITVSLYPGMYRIVWVRTGRSVGTVETPWLKKLPEYDPHTV